MSRKACPQGDDAWQKARWAYDAYQKIALAKGIVTPRHAFDDLSERSQNVWVEFIDATLHQFGPK